MDAHGLGFKAGLRVGDYLLTVNGEGCTDASQAAAMLKLAVGVLALEVIRKRRDETSRRSSILSTFATLGSRQRKEGRKS